MEQRHVSPAFIEHPLLHTPLAPEQDLFFQKLAEAEERLAEIESLQARMRELEEENAALTQVGGRACRAV